MVAESTERLDARTPPNSFVLRVGCPMWADRRWVGPLFPSDTPSGDELMAYATWCNAVEGNTSFYALPDPASVKRWAAQTPDGFAFCFKAPRTITHDRRLRHCEPEVDEFLNRFTPLIDRLGPLWLQLPPTFGPDDLGVLDRFLRSAPSDTSWAVEVRHPAFEAGGPHERAVNDLLHGYGAERVIIDTRALFAGPCQTPGEIEAFERKPRLRVRPVALGPQPIVRFIGQTAHEANPPFWEPWVSKVVQWLDEGRRPIVFLHTPDNARAPELARQFHAAVARQIRLAPLPEPSRAEVQPSLFDGAVEPRQ